MHNPASARNTKKGRDASSWAKGRKKSANSRIGSRDETTSEIEELISRKDWKAARFLIHEELVFDPMSHWLWMTLGLAYYEDREYEKSLACSKRAVELEPRCPLALWHFAGSLSMTGQGSSALAFWSLLLNMEMEDIAYGDCGEGMDQALQLVNDVHYRMGRYFQWQGEHPQARASFQKYLHNRKHGVASIYDKNEAEKHLAEVSLEPPAHA